jgi:Mg-chelatase subunit ChlD
MLPKTSSTRPKSTKPKPNELSKPKPRSKPKESLEIVSASPDSLMMSQLDLSSSSSSPYQSIASKQVFMKETEKEVFVKQKQLFEIVFVVDTSGSMSGAGIREAKKGLSEVFQTLDDKDRVRVVTFSDQPNLCLRPMIKSKIDSFDEVISQIQTGGGTALYSAIIDCIQRLRDVHAKSKENRSKGDKSPKEPRQIEIVVLTDGEDNRSPDGSLEILKSMLSNPQIPNFHLFLMGVGISKDYERVLRDMCLLSKSCKYVSVEEPSQIAEAYRTKVVKKIAKIRTQVVVEKRVTAKRSVVVSKK